MIFSQYSYLDLIWLSIGFAGQLLFSMRFLIQWLVSEYKKKSTIPLSFWYFSVFGGVTLLAYAIYKRDLVFILGQGIGLIIYIRNLYLIYNTRSNISAEPLAGELSKHPGTAGGPPAF